MASHQLDVLRVPGSIPGVAKIFHSLFDKSPQALMLRSHSHARHQEETRDNNENPFSKLKHIWYDK